jgi:filamentous hemagglutinin family protein
MHPRLHTLLLTTTALLALGTAPVIAGPDGARVVGGTATVTGSGTGNVIVNQTSQNTIINWNTFNIGVGQSTTFFQPNSSSIALNRVTGGMGPSEILGTLTANGRVFVINRDGVLFGAGSVVNTSGFLATTSDIRNADFMAGRMNFSIPGRLDASIVNQGHITATNGGFAALVAPGVRNSGTITATLGTVGLAAGNSFTLDFYGDKLITLAVGDQIAGRVIDVATGRPLNSLVTNDGGIKANGGRVELSASTARAVVDSVINTSGVIKANSVGVHNGMIVLGGATGSSKVAGAPKQTVKVSGIVSAAGKKKGTTGGTVVVTGEDIQVANAKIDASGRNGGGKVMIGGDWGGGNPNTGLVSNQSARLEGYAIPTATTVSVDAASTINVSAKDTGNGGKVILWSDTLTTFAGGILARGGANGGNGGFVETSSHGQLAFLGTVDGGAPKGLGGTLLLDPQDITINQASANSIALALAGMDVKIETDNTLPGTGNIELAPSTALSWASSHSLTLSAFNDIVFHEAASITNTGAGNLILRADNTGDGRGTVTFNAASKIDYTASTGSVSIYYNPSGTTKYQTPFNYNPFVRTTGPAANQLTAYMLVNSGNDLQNISTNLTGVYALGRDITATPGGGFTGFAANTQFNGLLDGNGGIGANHTISGLNLSSASGTSYGLFPFIGKDGTVRNLNLADATINAGANGQTIGLLAGENDGKIISVQVLQTPDGSSVSGRLFTGVSVGGLVGLNKGTITSSSSAARVLVGDGTSLSALDNNAGGLVGNNQGTITNGSATGSVTAGKFSYAGGLVGMNLGSIIGTSPTLSFAIGPVTGGYTVGGLVGANFVVAGSPAQIVNSQASGNVTVNPGGVAAGGLVGQNQGLVDQSSYVGSKVTGAGIGNSDPSLTQFASLGGLVGMNFTGGTITNSSATATVGGSFTFGGDTVASDFVLAGGLVGSNFGTVGTLLGPVSANANVIVGGAHSTGGALVGTNNSGGAITNANATGSVTVLDPSVLSKIGGLVGQNDGLIDRSSATNVTVTGGVGSVGGLVGQNGLGNGPLASITNSSATGTVSGSGAAGPGGGSASLGGLVGSNNSNGRIANSWANVTVNPGDHTVAGGLAGTNAAGAVITDSQAFGALQVIGALTQGGDFGGLVGNNQGAIVGTTTPTATSTCAVGASFSCASGSVTVPAGPGSNQTSNAGGLVGFNQGTGQNSGENGTIFNALATGNVIGASGSGDLTNRTSNLGGLVGTNQGKIANSRATGDVGGPSLNGGIGAGGLVADNSGQIVNSVATGNVMTGSGGQAGGLVANNSSGGAGGGGNNSQSIDGSSATGNVTVGANSIAGGLAGSNAGTIANSSYTPASAAGGVSNTGGPAVLGGLVGANNGTIGSSSANGGNVTGTGLGILNLSGGQSFPSAVGGFVGQNNGTITNSFATANVSVAGSGIGNFVGGGFAGTNEGTIQGTPATNTFTYATGNVTGSSNSIIGGFVGNNTGTITFAAYGDPHGLIPAGTVRVDSDSVAGGFFGANIGSISQAFSTGSVVEDANSVLGGFGGVNAGILAQVFATGPVTGGVNSVVGGLVAVNAAFAPPGLGLVVGSITDAYALGNVTGGTNSTVGGLVGINDGTILHTYSIGAVTGGTGSVLGGLVAQNNPARDLPNNFVGLPLQPGLGTISPENYWDTRTSGQNTSAGGTGKTTHELLAGLPAGFSPTIWTIQPDPSYPYFPWQPTSSIPTAIDPGPDVQPTPQVSPQPQPQIIANLIAPTTQLVALAPSPVVGNAQGGVRLPVFPQAVPGQPSTLTLPRIIDIPPLTETRFVADEVVLQIRCETGTPQLEQAVRAIGLSLAESQNLCNTTGTSVHRFRFPAGQTIQAVISSLAAVQIVAIAQPNYLYRLQQDAAPASDGQAAPDATQYVLQKLRLADVHRVVMGTNITIAVIDSQIDTNHPDLAGVIAQRFSAVGTAEKPHAHGTGMAGAIASHQRLVGIAPGARLFAVHAFSTSAATVESTTFQVLKGIDWATTQGARIINMSFAGPRDRSLERSIKAAYDKNIVLIAAAGNAGPSSPPLYPGADPNVIAVTATDIDDKLFPGANRGRYIAIAAPGVDIIVPAPEGTYQLTTGTSVAAAEVSGVVALMLERNPNLRPADIRRILTTSAKRLGPGQRDDNFGSGLVDLLAALRAADPRTASGIPAR